MSRKSSGRCGAQRGQHTMMTSMDIGLCKRRLEGVYEVGILAWMLRVGLSCRGSSAGKGRLSSLALAIFGSLGTTCCSTTFCALRWSVSASAIATVSPSCFAQAQSRRSLRRHAAPLSARWYSTAQPPESRQGWRCVLTESPKMATEVVVVVVVVWREGGCRCEVCDCDQDDNRKTVSEQGVQRVTSKSKKETAQT